MSSSISERGQRGVTLFPKPFLLAMLSFPWLKSNPPRSSLPPPRSCPRATCQQILTALYPKWRANRIPLCKATALVLQTTASPFAYHSRTLLLSLPTWSVLPTVSGDPGSALAGMTLGCPSFQLCPTSSWQCLSPTSHRGRWLVCLAGASSPNGLPGGGGARAKG